jgi:hypothetical protein
MSASATAADTGTLSSAEFRQLSAATAKLNASASSKSINWVKARAACRRIGGGTELLRSQRLSCLDTISALEALANFPSEQTRCAAAGTTTTGTTTTSGESAVIRVIICLSPRYTALERYAEALYRADAAGRKDALARGFTGACLATLASTPADLKKEKLFASSATRLARDVAVLIKVTRGKAPTTDLNQVQIDSDVTRFESSARAVLEENGPQKLSACPHQ